MKQILIAAAAAVLSASWSPSAAHAQTGCAWWDLTCNGLANTVADHGWHIAGRDANGTVHYVRRRVDSAGNVLFEQAQRRDDGRYVVDSTHTVQKGAVHGANGAVCKYKSNAKGYSEQCIYTKRVEAAERTKSAQQVNSADNVKDEEHTKGMKRVKKDEHSDDGQRPKDKGAKGKGSKR